MKKKFDMPLTRVWNESALHISYLPTTSQAKSTKAYAYIIHLPASNPTTAQTSALQQTCTLQDRHRTQLDKLEMYCKHRMKLKMFKSKKMQLGRGKHTGST